jgi:hypothetical protein
LQRPPWRVGTVGISWPEKTCSMPAEIGLTVLVGAWSGAVINLVEVVDAPETSGTTVAVTYLRVDGVVGLKTTSTQ